MRNIKHDRPELRWLDNMRRELGKAPNGAAEPQLNLAWPSYLRPVVSRKGSHVALSELFFAIDDWVSGGDVSFANFPLRLKTAADAFGRVRIQHNYDNRYCGREWIADLRKSDSEEGRALGKLLAFFVTPESDGL